MNYIIGYIVIGILLAIIVAAVNKVYEGDLDFDDFATGVHIVFGIVFLWGILLPILILVGIGFGLYKLAVKALISLKDSVEEYKTEKENKLNKEIDKIL